jgi:PAS domain S-box-containing protein
MENTPDPIKAEWLRITLSSIGEAIITCDSESRIIFLNPVAEKMAGCASGEAKGRPIQELFHLINEQTRNQPEDVVARVLREGRKRELVHPSLLVARDGREIPIELSVSPIYGTEDRVIGGVLVLRDMTENRRAREALQKSHDELEQRIEERTRELTGANKAIKVLNETLEKRIAERTSELEAANRRLRDSRRAALNLMEDAVSARQKAEETSADLRREVAERIRAESELQQISQQRQLALDAARMGWWHYDPATRICSWDDGYKKIFGVTGYQRPNEEILARLHPDDLPGVRAKVEAALDPLDPKPYLAEYRIRHPDGSIRWIEAHGIALFEGTGEARRAVSFVGTVADITERKESRVALERNNIALESINRELESFIYSVSHDLRGPLRAISGFSSILEKEYAGDLDSKGIDYLSRIARGGEKMSHLIDDLLRLSMITRQELERKDVDLSTVATEIIDELTDAHPGRQVSVQIEKGLTDIADPRLSAVMLSNLLRNAWKFTTHRDDAHIAFGADNRNGERVYYVKDNGVGFDPQFGPKMFLPFHRLHGDGEFEGTGVGLAIVERVVHRHGGRVWAEGAEGQGATLFFTLTPPVSAQG